MKLRFFHPWLRPIVQHFIAELRTVRRCNARARELLTPLIQARDNQEKHWSGGGFVEEYEKPNDAVEWLRDIVPEPDRSSAHFHAISQLGISAVSVTTTSELITNAIFNLAAYPEYVPLLKEEMECVLAKHGGQWSLESMREMKKMDSFVKETLRYNGHLTGTSILFSFVLVCPKQR